MLAATIVLALLTLLVVTDTDAGDAITVRADRPRRCPFGRSKDKN
ncbi:MAG TPA: hypothetical protein VFJ90_04240 [Candidatus Didemnitutus sp.]|nr:hypothetical protein [Candidatus Didemnitutus sp.]